MSDIPPSIPDSPSGKNASAHSFSLAATWKTLVDLVNGHDSESSEPIAPELEALEARVLYDASPLLAVAGENLEANVEMQLDEIAELFFEENVDQPAQAVGDFDDALVVDAQALGEFPAQIDTVSRQLVVIDERIEGFEALVADITGNGGESIAYDVLTIGKDQNGIELISEYLNGLTSYGAIHVVGHGSQDQIQLGSVDLSSESLHDYEDCLLYTSPSPRDKRQSRMPSSA